MNTDYTAPTRGGCIPRVCIRETMEGREDSTKGGLAGQARRPIHGATVRQWYFPCCSDDGNVMAGHSPAIRGALEHGFPLQCTQAPLSVPKRVLRAAADGGQ